MPTKARARQRVDWAFAELVQGRAIPHVVTDLTQRWGIKRRQAQRDVRAAYLQLVEEVNAVGDREALLAQAVVSLQQATQAALKAGQAAWVVGCIRQLDDLLGLGINHPGRPAPPNQYGRR
ncbi:MULTISPECIES: hypothetical protein [Aphanothece]|uniref:hypothetical protein n=1 Tax=Aphanothece TaxID=1121 RepID=UPI00398EE2B4